MNRDENAPTIRPRHDFSAYLGNSDGSSSKHTLGAGDTEGDNDVRADNGDFPLLSGTPRSSGATARRRERFRGIN